MKQDSEKVNQKPVDNIIKLNTLATLNDYDIMIGDIPTRFEHIPAQAPPVPTDTAPAANDPALVVDVS